MFGVSRSARRVGLFVVALSLVLAGFGLVRAASASTRDDSSDGGMLAFSKDGDIWSMNPDGSDLTRLTTDPALDRFPSWSPDGTKIAFSSKRTGNFEIWVMDANGANQQQITHDAPNNDGSPNWTADGSQLVYHLNFNSVYIINSSGSGTTQQLRVNAATPDTSPRNLVAFLDTVDEGLYTMNLAGSGVRFVTGSGFDPDWSPIGDRIAYLCTTPSTNNVCQVRPDGTGQLLLDSSPDRVDFSPTWSPNGKKIAFSGCLNFGTTTQDCEIYTVNTDGTHLKQITTFGIGPGTGGVDWGPNTDN